MKKSPEELRKTSDQEFQGSASRLAKVRRDLPCVPYIREVLEKTVSH